MLNLDNLKNQIESQYGDLTSHGSNSEGCLVLSFDIEAQGLDVLVAVKVRKNGCVQTDIQVSCDEETLIEGCSAFSKNQTELDIFNWCLTQIQYVIEEIANQ